MAMAAEQNNSSQDNSDTITPQAIAVTRPQPTTTTQSKKKKRKRTEAVAGTEISDFPTQNTERTSTYVYTSSSSSPPKSIPEADALPVGLGNITVQKIVRRNRVRKIPPVKQDAAEKVIDTLTDRNNREQSPNVNEALADRTVGERTLGNANNSANYNGACAPLPVGVSSTGASTLTMTTAGEAILHESLSYNLCETLALRRRNVQRPYIFSDASDDIERLLSVSLFEKKEVGLTSSITPLSTLEDLIKRKDLEEMLLHPDGNFDNICRDLVDKGNSETSIIFADRDVSSSNNSLSENMRGSNTLKNTKSLNKLRSILQRNNSANTGAPPLTARAVAQMITQLKLDAARKQRRVVFMLLLIFVIIVCCWCPIAIIHVLDIHNQYPSIYYVAFTILAWTNSCVNIFIYACMNPRFAVAYKALLKCSRVEDKEGHFGNMSVDFTGTLTNAGLKPNMQQSKQSRLMSIAEGD